jgi:peptidase E
MAQQLYLFQETTSAFIPDSSFDVSSDSLLEQTRQLFQHDGSNAELMNQVMNAIKALHEICEQPEE